MAVDANVLIFERTKEELRAGKNVKAALADGYKNAFSAIFDSNLTSVITAIILMVYGTGLIKGFATTLLISIICSFFTAVFISRLVFEALLKKKERTYTFTTRFSRNFLTGTKVDFLGQTKKAWTVIAAITVVIIVSFFVRGINKGIDFSGGRNYVVQFDHAVKTDDITTKLMPMFPDASVSVITVDNDSRVRVSTNYKINDNSDNVDQEIMQKLYAGLKDELNGMSYDNFNVKDEHHGVVSSEMVGPSIADDMTRGAVWSVLLSLVAIALYILLRFRDFSFSMGALVSLAFTSFVIIGFYSLFWGVLPFSMEIDQQFIAAILTIIGYAINDTVVVFDRIREMVGLYPKQDRRDVINKSLNTTLTRTVMTSTTTVLVLFVIFLLGGETIRGFVFAMLFGVILGTLSTIYVATPVAYSMMRRKMAKKSK
jgi:SecD/SecF fusion protein